MPQVKSDMKPCRWRYEGICEAGLQPIPQECPGDCETRRAFEALEKVADTVQREVTGWEFTSLGLCVVPLDGVERIRKALKRAGR